MPRTISKEGLSSNSLLMLGSREVGWAGLRLPLLSSGCAKTDATLSCRARLQCVSYFTLSCRFVQSLLTPKRR